jgi:hypothetical protein
MCFALPAAVNECVGCRERGRGGSPAALDQELARWFSLGVYAYAVMSNRLHIVLHVDPATAAS